MWGVASPRRTLLSNLVCAYVCGERVSRGPFHRCAEHRASFQDVRSNPRLNNELVFRIGTEMLSGYCLGMIGYAEMTVDSPICFTLNRRHEARDQARTDSGRLALFITYQKISIMLLQFMAYAISPAQSTWQTQPVVTTAPIPTNRDPLRSNIRGNRNDSIPGAPPVLLVPRILTKNRQPLPTCNFLNTRNWKQHIRCNGRSSWPESASPTTPQTSSQVRTSRGVPSRPPPRSSRSSRLGAGARRCRSAG